MKILIIRHGEPDYAHDSLTEKGFREAEALSVRLAKEHITHIYSSPLGRAKRTAAPTAEKLGLTVETLPWLKEFSGKLELDGQKRIPWNLPPRIWSDREKLYDIHTWSQDEMMSNIDTPEQYRYVTENLDALLKSLGYERKNIIYTCDGNRDETIAFFCHFGLGMVLLSHFTGITPTLLWQTMFLPTSSVTALVTEVREEHEVIFKCMQVGDTSHLYAAGEPVSRSGLYPEFFGGVGCGPQV